MQIFVSTVLGQGPTAELMTRLDRKRALSKCGDHFRFDVDKDNVLSMTWVDGCPNCLPLAKQCEKVVDYV